MDIWKELSETLRAISVTEEELASVLPRISSLKARLEMLKDMWRSAMIVFQPSFPSAKLAE